MELNNDLITQFAKIAKINTKTKDTTTVRGTVHISDGRIYINLDGADASTMTPAETTVEINEGDRVIAAVKDHSIVITGNKTNPSVGTVTAGKLSSTIEQTAESITAKVTADYTDLNGKLDAAGNRIANAESKITQTANEIRSEVSANYDTLDSKISSATSTFTQRADQIQGTVTANYNTLDKKITDGDNDLSGRITSATSTFTQRADQIEGKVTANYNTLDNKIGTVSSTLTQTATSITGRVESLEGADTKFSEFKQTVEGFSFMGKGGSVKISGGDLNLTGAITWGDLSSGAQTTINSVANGAQNTANTALSNAATAQSTANTAVSNAATAQNKANSAYTLAEQAMTKAEANALPSYIKSTYIDGTQIQSPTIVGGTIHAVGTDPNSNSTFTTMDEQGFYMYHNASKADLNNMVYPKISMYCNDDTYKTPMIVLGSGSKDNSAFHNRFLIQKNGTSVDMSYHFDYSYPGCGLTFNQDGTIKVDGELRGVDGLFPIGYIYISYDKTSPASLFGGTWARLSAVFLYATSNHDTIGNTSTVVIAGGTNTANSVNVAAWRRTA